MAFLLRSTRLRPTHGNGLKSQLVHRQFSLSLSRHVTSAEAVEETRPMSERLSLKGKTTIITGGARGIGLSLVEAAAEAGSNVAVFDRLDEPQRDLSKLGVKAKYYRYEN
jgi:NADPH:quinone reductase-like Zn-dependent oxidoreductase